MDDLLDQMDDPHEEIERLEAKVVELTARIESCRKFIAASRAAIVLGVVLLGAGVFRLVVLDPMLLAGSVVAVLGGIVMSGSNRSTAQEAEAALAATEIRRAELIEAIGPHEIGATRVLH